VRKPRGRGISTHTVVVSRSQSRGVLCCCHSELVLFSLALDECPMLIALTHGGMAIGQAELARDCQ